MPIKLKPPRLLHKNGTATIYMTMLRCCETQAHKGGYPHPYKRPDVHWLYNAYQGREGKALGRLLLLGWVEAGPFGPRGGQRWRLTEEGKLVCQLVTQHGVRAQQLLVLLPSVM